MSDYKYSTTLLVLNEHDYYREAVVDCLDFISHTYAGATLLHFLDINPKHKWVRIEPYHRTRDHPKGAITHAEHLEDGYTKDSPVMKGIDINEYYPGLIIAHQYHDDSSLSRTGGTSHGTPPTRRPAPVR